MVIIIIIIILNVQYTSLVPIQSCSQRKCWHVTASTINDWYILLDGPQTTLAFFFFFLSHYTHWTFENDNFDYDVNIPQGIIVQKTCNYAKFYS